MVVHLLQQEPIVNLISVARKVLFFFNPRCFLGSPGGESIGRWVAQGVGAAAVFKANPSESVRIQANPIDSKQINLNPSKSIRTDFFGETAKILVV